MEQNIEHTKAIFGEKITEEQLGNNQILQKENDIAEAADELLRGKEIDAEAVAVMKDVYVESFDGSSLTKEQMEENTAQQLQNELIERALEGKN